MSEEGEGEPQQKDQYFPKRRVSNVMAALFIIWTLAIWTWIIDKLLSGAILVEVTDDGGLMVVLSPALAIVTSILAMLNVALGFAAKYLWDSSAHD